jgi:hypothetical protein
MRSNGGFVVVAVAAVRLAFSGSRFAKRLKTYLRATKDQSNREFAAVVVA